MLGNHNTVRIVPELEEMGIRMLLNKSVPIEHGGGRIHLAGIDDAHYYRVDNIEKAASRIPQIVSFCSRIHPKYTAKRPTPISSSCSAAIPMVVRFAFLAAFPSR